jgi:tetratricopeptide (TPR) repeat protein
MDRQHAWARAGATRRALKNSGLCAGACLAWLLTACSHGPQVRPGQLGAPVTSVEMEPLQLEVGRPGSEAEIFDAPTLFEEGGQHLDADRYADAAASYERLLKNFPDSPYVPPALYNAALSYEGLGRFADAAERYRKILDEHSASKQVKDALFRLGACYAETGRWVASAEIYGQAVQRSDLALSDRLEATARLGLAHFELHDLPVAEQHFGRTVELFKSQGERERLETDFFLAMSHFYLAHIAHLRFRELPVRLPQQQLERDLEAKARAFLDAQVKYVEAIKVKNPSWATAAGYHVGTLYRELYDALAKAPLPPEVRAGDQRVIYDLLLRDKLRVLLEKAKDILEKNVSMAERVGVKNGWVARSTEQLQEVARLLASLDGGGSPTATLPAAATTPAASPPEAAPPKVPARPKKDYRPRVNL